MREKMRQPFTKLVQHIGIPGTTGSMQPVVAKVKVRKRAGSSNPMSDVHQKSSYIAGILM
jgi:hypothetical protein